MEPICITQSTYRAPPAIRYDRNRRFRRLLRPIAAAAAASSDSGGNRMFVLGTGFVGRYVAEQLKLEGWEVSGTCRSAIKQRELEEMGFDAFLFDAHKSAPGVLPTLQHASHVLVSIPPIAGSDDPVLSLHEGLRSTLRGGNLKWLCYLSSTSVYGDCGGAWVNEDYPVNPVRASAKSRLMDERRWLDLGRELRVPVNIFRLGGIYGPGRSALDTIGKQKFMSEEQKKRESRLYTARIHVADIYQAVKASLDSRACGRIYNIVDDDPAPREEVFAYALSLIEERWPGKISKLTSDVIDSKAKKRNRGGEKRVLNTRLKEDLGVKLLYPNYRSGLKNILDSYGPQFPCF